MRVVCIAWLLLVIAAPIAVDKVASHQLPLEAHMVMIGQFDNYQAATEAFNALEKATVVALQLLGADSHLAQILANIGLAAANTAAFLARLDPSKVLVVAKPSGVAQMDTVRTVFWQWRAGDVNYFGGKNAGGLPTLSG